MIAPNDNRAATPQMAAIISHVVMLVPPRRRAVVFSLARPPPHHHAKGQNGDDTADGGDAVQRGLFVQQAEEPQEEGEQGSPPRLSVLGFSGVLEAEEFLDQYFAREGEHQKRMHSQQKAYP